MIWLFVDSLPKIIFITELIQYRVKAVPDVHLIIPKWVGSYALQKWTSLFEKKYPCTDKKIKNR